MAFDLKQQQQQEEEKKEMEERERGGGRTRTMTLPELRMPVKVIMVEPHFLYPPLASTVDAVMKSA